MVDFKAKIIEKNLELQNMIAFLKEKSDYWPEIYLHLEDGFSEDSRVVHLSTLQRYKHGGVWYTRHHIVKLECCIDDLERMTGDYKHQLATQIYYSQVAGTYTELDDKDECQLDEKERLFIKYPWLKPKQT